MSRIEFLVEDIFEFLAEIRVYGCLDIWFHPMGFDSHLTHIVSNCFFGNIFPGFSQFCSNFRSTVVLMGFLVDLLNFFF